MRPPRIEVSDYPYHVIARGNNKQNIFLDDSDRKRYLGILRLAKRKFGFLLHTYTLMTNHIHLLLTMNDGFLLSRLMHWIQLGYARYFNTKYQGVGHVFEARYHAILVDKDDYFITVDRYIHLNPVRAGMVANPEDFLWSSYRSRFENAMQTPWLDHDTVLDYFSENPLKRLDGYRQFTMDAIKKPEEWSLENLFKTRFRGSAEFIERFASPTEISI